jgi:hypothetical protein
MKSVSLRATEQMDIELSNFRTMSTLMEKEQEGSSTERSMMGNGENTKGMTQAEIDAKLEEKVHAKNKRLGDPHWLVFALLLKPCCTIIFGFFSLILLTYIASDSRAFSTTSVLLVDYFDQH